MNIVRISPSKLASAIDGLGITQEELSIKLNISQSQISRVLTGKVTSRSKAYRLLCGFMRISWEVDPLSSPQAQSDDTIAIAVRNVWNGTPEHAEAIAGVIRSLAAFETDR